MAHRPKCKTIKLPEENVGENLYELGFDSEILVPKEWTMDKMHKFLDFIKIKIKLCFLKRYCKGQATDWESNICKSYSS